MESKRTISRIAAGERMIVSGGRSRDDPAPPRHPHRTNFEEHP